MSNNPDENAIRARAYAIWEQAGRPEGRHEDHWRQASEELTVHRTKRSHDKAGEIQGREDVSSSTSRDSNATLSADWEAEDE